MRRRIVVGMLTIAGLVAGVPIAADDAALTDDERAALLDATLLGFVVDLFGDDTEQLCPQALADGARLNATALAKHLGVPYESRVPRRDPWGSSFDVECEHGEVTVLSPGPNRVYEHGYGREDVYRERHAADTDDLVIVHGKVVQGPVPTIVRARRTIADVRSVATAIEEYAIDNNQYPSPTGGLVPLSLIESDLEPIYIRTLPLTDQWGNEILLWSTGAHYLLLSRGADGVLDFDAERVMIDGLTAGLPGAVDDFGADLVFLDGRFVQWWAPTVP